MLAFISFTVKIRSIKRMTPSVPKVETFLKDLKYLQIFDKRKITFPFMLEEFKWEFR